MNGNCFVFVEPISEGYLIFSQTYFRKNRLYSISSKTWNPIT